MTAVPERDSALGDVGDQHTPRLTIGEVLAVLHDDFPDGVEAVAAYRLDGHGFYVVQVVMPTGSDASFTIELLDASASPSARVVRQPR